MTNYLDWKVGDEVVFIDLGISFLRDGKKETLFEENKVYKIRKIGYEPRGRNPVGGDDLCLWVEGVFRNSQNIYDLGTSIERFRKLQKRKTDISQFQAMLNQTLLTNQIELTVKERMPENV